MVFTLRVEFGILVIATVSAILRPSREWPILSDVVARAGNNVVPVENHRLTPFVREQ